MRQSCRRKKNSLYRKAQSIMGHAILLVAVVGVVVAMGSYMKRGYQGRLKGTIDQVSHNLFDPNDGGSETRMFVTEGNDEYVTEDRSDWHESGGVYKTERINTNVKTR